MASTNTNGIIILGSARSDGNTRRAVKYLSEVSGMPVVDLNDHQIEPFEYDNYHRSDDFLPLIKRLIECETIVFATPVYWYSMSSVLKNFFDRITDLLQAHKDIGRQLRGKRMALLSCSGTPGPDPDFAIPFRKTANYLGMHFAGHVTTWLDGDTLPIPVIRSIEQFTESITSDVSQES